MIDARVLNVPHHLACKLRAQLGHTRGAAKLPAVAWPEHATMRKIVQSIGKQREEQQLGGRRTEVEAETG